MGKRAALPVSPLHRAAGCLQAPLRAAGAAPSRPAAAPPRPSAPERRVPVGLVLTARRAHAGGHCVDTGPALDAD